MKKTITYLMAAFLTVSLVTHTAKAQTEYPYFSNSEVVTDISTVATTVADPSTALLDLNGNFTIEVSGTTGIEITITNGPISYSYTPTTTGNVRFVKKSSNVYVYEGITYKGKITPTAITYPTIADTTATTSTAQMLKNASFETTGGLVSGTNFNFGTPWVTNVTVAASGGIRIGTNASAVNGTYVCIWRGSGNSNYFAQPVTGIKANTSYQVIVRQVAGSNAYANFNVGIGSTASGLEFGSTTIRLGNTYNGTRTATFSTALGVADTGFFTFKNTATNTANTGTDPLTQIDYIALVEGTLATTSGIKGTSGNVYYINNAYSPQININYSAGDYYDITPFIVNPSFEVGGVTGWTNNGMATQTNVPGNGWTKDGSVYCEKWVNQAGNLPVAGINQKVTGLPNGVYKLKAAGHAIKQGATDPNATTGAYIFAGMEQKLVNAGAEYEVSNVVVVDSSLTFGFKTEGTITCNWAAVDNFRLSYYGPYTAPVITANVTGLSMEDLSPKDSITITGANITSNITITTPAGITVNPAIISKTGTISTKVYVNYDGITSVNDSIVITCGLIVKKVGIKAISNAACFKPLYATGNIISNPYFSTLTGYGGWGSRAITTDAAEVYCGNGSYKTSGDCGGSLDYSLTSKVQANTVYRLRAMVKTTGKFKFIINGCNVGGSANYYLDVNTSDAWQSAVFTFTTGATMDANQNLFFNSCEGYKGTLAFIDNLELYKLPLYVTPATVDFIGASTKDVTVKAQVLTDSIMVTAPAGFSVPKGKLAPDKTSALSITFDGVTAASGYVYLTSGANKDSVLVSGTNEPTIAINASYLGFDELNPKDSIIVDGGNLTSDITITAPAGITVNPTTILKSNATNVKVIVTYDGTSIANGNITVTSGTLSKTIAVKAAPNASCYTKLYTNGTNLVADPYLNSLSTFFGWGTKTVNTDPAFVYCGTRSGKVSGGSIDVHLTGGMQINTTYRVKAKVWKVSGTIQIGVFGWNGAAADINHEITVADSWQDVDFTFTTGATLGGGQGVFFNSGVGYIDNWEIYALSNDATLTDLKVNGTTTTGFAAGTITYNVVLPFGTTAIPVVAATVNEPNATTVITQAASVNGSATVEVTAQDGTTKTTYTINFSVSTVGNPTIADNSFVSVKPTISSSDFMVEFAGKLGKISVIDSRGKLVSSKVASKSTEVISVPSSGIYTIQINVNGAIKTVKVVKTK